MKPFAKSKRYSYRHDAEPSALGARERIVAGFGPPAPLRGCIVYVIETYTPFASRLRARQGRSS
jgi:hypothetical protein